MRQLERTPWKEHSRSIPYYSSRARVLATNNHISINRLKCRATHSQKNHSRLE